MEKAILLKGRQEQSTGEVRRVKHIIEEDRGAERKAETEIGNRNELWNEDETTFPI